MAKALVIEPKDALREQVAQVLRDKGIFVSLAKKASEATAMLETSPVDLVLMDIEMPEVHGSELLRRLRERSPSLPIIVLGAGRSFAAESEATRFGASVVRSEPLDVEELLRRVGYLVNPWGPASLAAHVVRDLHDPETGRLDAKRIAEYLALPLSTLADGLGRSVAAVHKSPASLPLQEKLAPIAWTIGALSLVLRSRDNLLTWLNSPHPDLDGHTPMSLIVSGRAVELSDMVKAALAGQPA